MYCVKCRCVTETENITTATSINDRLMRYCQCITRCKTETQFVARGGGSFLNTLVNKFLSKCIYKDITLVAWEQNSIRD